MRLSRRLSKIPTVGKILFFLLSTILSVTVYLAVVGRGVVMDLLSQKARAQVTDIVNSSNEVISKMDVFYEDYFTVHYDETGAFDSISANSGLINQVNTILQTEIQNRLNAFRTMTMVVPFGALTGSPILSNYGMDMSVRAQLVGNCSTVLKSTFVPLGINNTVHQLKIDCVVELEMVVPTGTTVQNVNNEFLLAETVISGKVPSTYLGENANTDYLDLLPD